MNRFAIFTTFPTRLNGLRDYLRIWNQFNLLLTVHEAARKGGKKITMLHCHRKFMSSWMEICFLFRVAFFHAARMKKKKKSEDLLKLLSKVEGV